MSDYLEKLERQVNETENTSPLFGNISVVNSRFLKKAVEELKAARDLIEELRGFVESDNDRLISTQLLKKYDEERRG